MLHGSHEVCQSSCLQRAVLHGCEEVSCIWGKAMNSPPWTPGRTAESRVERAEQQLYPRTIITQVATDTFHNRLLLAHDLPIRWSSRTLAQAKTPPIDGAHLGNRSGAKATLASFTAVFGGTPCWFIGTPFSFRIILGLTTSITHVLVAGLLSLIPHWHSWCGCYTPCERLCSTVSKFKFVAPAFAMRPQPPPFPSTALPLLP